MMDKARSSFAAVVIIGGLSFAANVVSLSIPRPVAAQVYERPAVAVAEFAVRLDRAAVEALFELAGQDETLPEDVAQGDSHVLARTADYQSPRVWKPP